MDIGFETIGNATLICHDQGPVLVTDPWVSGPAYFGSWTLSHEIPEEQLDNIRQCKFVWTSHGHPDHLSMESLKPLMDKTILVADHVGGRIADSLRELGFSVTVLQDRVWTSLSPRINVLSIADYNQDSILLVDIDGTLVLDLNDTTPRGWGGFIRKIVRQYDRSFLLQLFGYGDADMINFFTEDGERILPRAALKMPVGPVMARVADWLGATDVIPFSSLHRYQRLDSAWANQYTTPLSAYPEGFESDTAQILPGFVSYNCATGQIDEINPAENPEVLLDPKEFGDDWSQPLGKEDLQKVRDYFQPISHLGKAIDFINLRVGGEDNFIELRSRGFKKGIIFEVPRRSLMRCVRWQIFDDLLIGNFMKTTMVGNWPSSRLYPDFGPYVGKYADNGLARSDEELRAYFRQYRDRAPIEFFRHQLQQRVASAVRGHMDSRSPLYQTAQKVWWLAMRRGMS